MISITEGLYSSDKIYKNIPIKNIKNYLTTHTHCYEKTKKVNRVYIDIDGYAVNEISEKNFNNLNFIIINKLKLIIKTNASLMTSSSYKYKKFSFRIVYKKLYGKSKEDIKLYITNNFYPILSKIFSNIIIVYLNKKRKKTENVLENYLAIDLSIYNLGDRKMRMWNSTKEGEDRPFILLSGRLRDTLITYIPKGAKVL